MAITVSRYNHTIKKCLNGEIDYTDLAFMLLNSSGTFNAAHTSINSVAGAADPTRDNEVFGNGWTEGGEDLENCAVTVVTTDDAMIDADDISVTATGGIIGPARHGVIYEKTSGDVLWHYNLGQDEQAGETTDFRVRINTSGILRTADPA